MSNWIEIIIALLILGLILRYINYVLAFFSVIPNQLLSIALFCVAIALVLFVIHRRK